jgi:seryl-tRNA(Sec) selenium transferase
LSACSPPLRLLSQLGAGTCIGRQALCSARHTWGLARIRASRTPCPAAGADLIAYAAKYFGAPNASGFLAGKRELVEAAAAQGFIAFEHGFHAAIGRPLKLDRQVIIAIVVALQERLATDHEARLRNNDRKAQTIARAIRGLAGVTVTQRPDPPARATSLQVCIDRTKVGKSVAELGRTLESGYPAVWVGTPERFGPYMGVSHPTNTCPFSLTRWPMATRRSSPNT